MRYLYFLARRGHPCARPQTDVLGQGLTINEMRTESDRFGNVWVLIDVVATTEGQRNGLTNALEAGGALYVQWLDNEDTVPEMRRFARQ